MPLSATMQRHFPLICLCVSLIAFAFHTSILVVVIVECDKFYSKTLPTIGMRQKLSIQLHTLSKICPLFSKRPCNNANGTIRIASMWQHKCNSLVCQRKFELDIWYILLNVVDSASKTSQKVYQFRGLVCWLEIVLQMIRLIKMLILCVVCARAWSDND